MVMGFALAAYAIVANDSIQTLGTFLSSNAKRPWWVLWIWISGILAVTVIGGWMMNNGDPAFGRLGVSKKDIPFPSSYGGTFTWVFILPPLCLVILTRLGIPVSTSLLVLTSFKGLVAAQAGNDGAGALDLFRSMMEKSLFGYVIAFVIGLVIFFAVLAAGEKRRLKETEEERNRLNSSWLVIQWLSTGFLWFMWLAQDLANIFAYLPRQISLSSLLLAVTGMVLLQGYLISKKGGKIQRVVTSKTNTLDVRSATFIDLFYGIVLLIFYKDIFHFWPEKLPMSTTWVFLGLIGGREIGLALRLRHRSKQKVALLVGMDAGKALLGSIIAVALAFFLPIFIVPVKQTNDDKADTTEAAQLPQSETAELSFHLQAQGASK